MNRTIKDATGQALLLTKPHDELRAHLADFVTAYNFAKRSQDPQGFSRPYEHICKVWTKRARNDTPSIRSTKCRD